MTRIARRQLPADPDFYRCPACKEGTMKFTGRDRQSRRKFKCDACGHELNGQALEHEAHSRSR